MGPGDEQGPDAQGGLEAMGRPGRTPRCTPGAGEAEEGDEAGSAAAEASEA